MAQRLAIFPGVECKSVLRAELAFLTACVRYSPV